MPKSKVTKAKKTFPKKESIYGPLLTSHKNATIRWSHFVNYPAAGLSVQTYALNSLYDPDYSGSGTQPVGFDEIMTMFYYYRVISVRVRISCTNAGSAGIIAVTPSRDATLPTQITAMAANDGSVSELIAGTYGQNKKVIVKDINIAQFLGLKSNIGDDLHGTVTGSPSRVLYLHIGLEEIDLSAKDMSLFCEFEFRTKFYNPLQLDNS